MVPHLSSARYTLNFLRTHGPIQVVRESLSIPEWDVPATPDGVIRSSQRAPESAPEWIPDIPVSVGFRVR
jgi:hypothetical protein